MESALLVDPETTERAAELRRQMAEIRCALRDRAQDAAEGVRQRTDWRYLVSFHPWAALSTAAVLGYLLVPSRRKTFVDADTARQVIREAQISEAPAKKVTVWSLLGLALPIIQGVITRRAVNYFDRLLKDSEMSTLSDPLTEVARRRR